MKCRSVVADMTKSFLDWSVVVVMWSTSSPSTPKIRVKILQKPTVFCKICVWQNENKLKEAGVGTIKKFSTTGPAYYVWEEP